MRMPNMSHRAPTLNSEKETSRKSFSFWQSVIARALRSYLWATVCTVYSFTPTRAHTHTHTDTMKEKSLFARDATHVDENIQTQTYVAYAVFIPTVISCHGAHTHTSAAHTWIHNDRAADLRLFTCWPENAGCLFCWSKNYFQCKGLINNNFNKNK